MADVDLLFRQAPITGQPVDLLLGETEALPDITATLTGSFGPMTFEASVVPPVYVYVSGSFGPMTAAIRLGGEGEVRLSGSFGSMTFEAFVGDPYPVTLSGSFEPMTALIVAAPIANFALAASFEPMSFAVEAVFDSATERPTVGQRLSSYEIADPVEAGLSSPIQPPIKQPAGFEPLWQTADMVEGIFVAEQPDSLGPMRDSRSAVYTEADDLRAGALHPHGDGLRDRRPSMTTDYAEADDLRSGVWSDFQDRYRDRRPSVTTGHTSARPLWRVGSWGFQKGLSVRRGRWARYQDAMRPPAGMWVPPLPPGPDPCYTPSTDLLFDLLPGTSDLLFICDNHDDIPPGETVIVPVRRVYIVINDVSLRRIEGNLLLPALTLSLSIDVDSWTFGFNATLPWQSRADIERAPGDPPVEVEASFNGHVYRLLVEKVAARRSFPNDTVQISGRGKNAVLASPHAPVLSFGNSETRTAQQLMNDVLTFNGVPIGWGVDWGLTDWLVPAGVFNARGSYIDGLSSIVSAAGGYLQPHPTDDTILARLRYPVAPWDWTPGMADYELPSAAVSNEGIDWIDKANYNRVYVSGQSAGILGRVTRAGTAGDLVAPMITDPLITEAAAARQRGISILADTGRQAMVSLRVPVFDETGVIHPGKMVRYVDGTEARLGIVRSTGIEFSGPELWQNLTVETHE